MTKKTKEGDREIIVGNKLNSRQYCVLLELGSVMWDEADSYRKPGTGWPGVYSRLLFKSSLTKEDESARQEELKTQNGFQKRSLRWEASPGTRFGLLFSFICFLTCLNYLNYCRAIMLEFKLFRFYLNYWSQYSIIKNFNFIMKVLGMFKEFLQYKPVYLTAILLYLLDSYLHIHPSIRPLFILSSTLFLV